MADDPTNLSPTDRSVLAIGALVFHASAIALVAWFGDPKNSLHTSLLAWSEAGSLAIFAGLGFPTLLNAWKGSGPP